MLTFLYPGQGDQFPGMLAALPEAAIVEQTVHTASDVLGLDIRKLDSPAVIDDTVAAQLLLLTVGVAYTRALQSLGIQPDVVLGHSIGAFAAAVTAGALTFEESVALVQLRATGMRDLAPTGFGLLALLGARRSTAERVVAEASGDADLFVAMENAEDQIVLAGSDDAFTRVQNVAAEAGVGQVRRLHVPVPSHCELMEPVATQVQAALNVIPPRPLRTRYIAGSTARQAHTAAAVFDDLSSGVARMVRWRDATDLTVELGTTAFVQLPPGHTTASLLRAAHTDIAVTSTDGSSIADVAARTDAYLADR